MTSLLECQLSGQGDGEEIDWKVKYQTGQGGGDWSLIIVELSCFDSHGKKNKLWSCLLDDRPRRESPKVLVPLVAGILLLPTAPSFIPTPDNFDLWSSRIPSMLVGIAHDKAIFRQAFRLRNDIDRKGFFFDSPLSNALFERIVRQSQRMCKPRPAARLKVSSLDKGQDSVNDGSKSFLDH